MYRERTLFLGQEIRCEITNHIPGLMVYLSIEDGCFMVFLEKFQVLFLGMEGVEGVLFWE